MAPGDRPPSNCGAGRSGRRVSCDGRGVAAWIPCVVASSWQKTLARRRRVDDFDQSGVHVVDHAHDLQAGRKRGSREMDGHSWRYVRVQLPRHTAGAAHSRLRRPDCPARSCPSVLPDCQSVPVTGPDDQINLRGNRNGLLLRDRECKSHALAMSRQPKYRGDYEMVSKLERPP